MGKPYLIIRSKVKNSPYELEFAFDRDIINCLISDNIKILICLINYD